MVQVNIPRLLENMTERTSVYSPIIEAVVNSIQAIEETHNEHGEVLIKLVREKQKSLPLDEDAMPAINSIEIYDNGIGFTDKHRESFETIYSDEKAKIGGKGFGRFTFLKYFKKVSVDSTYSDNGKYFRRTFEFTSAQNFFHNEQVSNASAKALNTAVFLNDFKEEHKYKLEKKLETIARQILEKLLIYFISDRYKCPKITISDGGTSIILNEFLKDNEGITQVCEDYFELTKKGITKKFKVKIFKIYHTQSSSSICLTAHDRLVTMEPLHTYIPEFKDEFVDKIKSENDKGFVNKNYIIKAYVLSDYLDDNVSLERDDFKFSKDQDLLYICSQREIESKTAEIVSDKFKDDLISRKTKKRERIKKYVDEEAPWHRSYIDELDITPIPFHIDNVSLEGELQKLKFTKERTAKDKINKILAGEKPADVTQEIEDISVELTEMGKSDLAHYVVTRRVVLDLLKKSLQWDENQNYEKEKTVHSIIFPLKSDSDHISYDQHNLWVIDERLSFQEYIASDKPLNKNDKRPDLLIFDRPIAVREDGELSNPITIFEFKRPQRKNYGHEDPIKQILSYVEKIRKGNFKDIDGRNIKANEVTPAYGFLICDINEEIKEYCKDHSLTLSPDQDGYFGYHKGYDTYLEVISFDKLVKDAELRNRIFFKKLGIN